MRDRIGNRRGLTLLEVVISTLLVGLTVVGAMNGLGAVIRGQTLTRAAIQSQLLASDLMAEILACAYSEPAGTPSFGVEAGESASVRTAWDDVDDYHLWAASPPQTRSGASIANATDLRREVVVQWVSPSDPSVVVGNDQGVKRITVIVKRNAVVESRLVALRTNR
jgi:Tfp pilus assembly protein PilV